MADIDGNEVIEGQAINLELLPGSGYSTDLVFTAPADGAYAIEGDFVAIEGRIGAGISVGDPLDILVTNVAGAQGDQIGAVVVCDTTRKSAEELRGSARELLSSFKVPKLWLLVDSDDVIPRGPTGKVDAPRLRELLADGAS